MRIEYPGGDLWDDHGDRTTPREEKSIATEGVSIVRTDPFMTPLRAGRIQYQAVSKGISMKPFETLKLRDSESSEDILIILRCDEKNVALSLSIKSDGDIQTVITKEDARKLLESLKRLLGDPK
ncbi:MAG TPA: hypothetical protein VFM25_04940 [Verrucomicrobiae bacterium]|nr:hypothetical protein [Verrucomicrobiae bacterium]